VEVQCVAGAAAAARRAAGPARLTPSPPRARAGASRYTTGTPHYVVNGLPVDDQLGNGQLADWIALLDPLLGGEEGAPRRANGAPHANHPHPTVGAKRVAPALKRFTSKDL